MDHCMWKKPHLVILQSMMVHRQNITALVTTHRMSLHSSGKKWILLVQIELVVSSPQVFQPQGEDVAVS